MKRLQAAVVRHLPYILLEGMGSKLLSKSVGFSKSWAPVLNHYTMRTEWTWLEYSWVEHLQILPFFLLASWGLDLTVQPALCQTWNLNSQVVSNGLFAWIAASLTLKARAVGLFFLIPRCQLCRRVPSQQVCPAGPGEDFYVYFWHCLMHDFWSPFSHH